MSATPKEQGQDVAHELMSSPTINITQAGYVYIYLSNEETTPVEVYFDDFTVTHTKSPVIQSQEFYPFGAEFNKYSRENSVPNQYMFNGGNELQDELGLDVYWADLRTYDPWGRLGWWQIDPMVDEFHSESPYLYSHNNPIRYNDPKGDCPECLFSMATMDAAVNPNGVGAHALGFAKGIENSIAGLVNAVAHPIETAEGMGNLALAGLSQGNPGAAMQIDNALGTHSYETGMAVSNALATGANDLISGNGAQRGQVLGEVAGAVIGAKGISATVSAVSTAVKANTAVNVFRVFGGDAEAAGYSWTPKSPNTVSNYRNVAGLPSGGASGKMNTGRFVVEGTTKNKNIIKSQPAAPLDGNKGGLTEYKINPKNVKVKRVSGANPEF